MLVFSGCSLDWKHFCSAFRTLEKRGLAANGVAPWLADREEADHSPSSNLTCGVIPSLATLSSCRIKQGRSLKHHGGVEIRDC